MGTRYCSDVSVLNCVYEGNSSVANGGGIRFRDSWDLSVADCLFVDNSSGQTGGGAYMIWSGDSEFKNCIFESNVSTTRSGGGIGAEAYGLLISGGSIRNNLSANDGGGVYLNGDIVLSGVDLFGNQSGNYGGGIHCGGNGYPEIINCNMSSNISGQQGGGLSAFDTDGLSVVGCLPLMWLFKRGWAIDYKCATNIRHSCESIMKFAGGINMILPWIYHTTVW